MPPRCYWKKKKLCAFGYKKHLVFKKNMVGKTFLKIKCNYSNKHFLIDVKFASGIINIHIGFAHIHQYMCIYSVLTRVMFKKTQAYYSGGIRTHDHCNSRAGSYQTTEIARWLQTFLTFWTNTVRYLQIQIFI